MPIGPTAQLVLAKHQESTGSNWNGEESCKQGWLATGPRLVKVVSKPVPSIHLAQLPDSGRTVTVPDGTMTRAQFFAVFFFAAFLFLLFQFYQIFGVFLVPLTWAALLAIVFYPLQSFLTRILRKRSGLAALILTTFVIAVVMIPTILITGLLANESVTLYQKVAIFVRDGQAEQFLSRLKEWTPPRGWQAAQNILDDWNIEVGSIAVRAANFVSSFLALQVAGIAKNIASFVANFLLTTFALFFFFRDGEKITNFIRDLVPMESRHKDDVLSRLYETVSAVVQGTLTTAVVQGLLAGLGYWILNVPFTVFLGCLTAFLSLLPFGTPLIWGGGCHLLGRHRLIGQGDLHGHLGHLSRWYGR